MNGTSTDREVEVSSFLEENEDDDDINEELDEFLASLTLPSLPESVRRSYPYPRHNFEQSESCSNGNFQHPPNFVGHGCVDQSDSAIKDSATFPIDIWKLLVQPAMQEIVVHTLQSVTGVIRARESSFELFGCVQMLYLVLQIPLPFVWKNILFVFIHYKQHFLFVLCLEMVISNLCCI